MTQTAGRPQRRQKPRSPWSGIDGAISRQDLRAFAPGNPDVARDLFSRLPRAWIEWVRRYGALSTADGTRWLLGQPADGDPDMDAVRTTRLLRILHPAIPRDLLPIELLPERQAAFVVTGDDHGPVVLLDLDDIEAGVVPWAPSLIDFVYDWRADASSVAAVLRHLNQQEQDVEAGCRAADQLERPGEWTVTRMCSEDVVLAVLRTRHNREHNRQDVSVFATATLSSFASGAPVRAALCAVLSDAYRSGGPLAVSFGANGDGPLPGPLRRWAAERGVLLPFRGGWDVATGEKLYALAANLTPETRDLLPLDGVATAAICFAVASGAWPPVAVEALLRWSRHPSRILTGAVSVTDRLSWLVDQQVMRAALTVAAIRRRLERAGQRSASDDDDTTTPVEVTFGDTVGDADPSTSSVTFTVPEGHEARLGWDTLVGAERGGSSLTGHVLAVENDLLPRLLGAITQNMPPGRVVIVPADANSSTDPALAVAFKKVGQSGLTVLASPDYTTTLDNTADAVVFRARTART